MMEQLNEIIDGLAVDIVSEGMGTTFGYILMWGLFFGGTYALFSGFMNLLSSAV